MSDSEAVGSLYSVVPLAELPPQVREWWKKLLATEHTDAYSVEDKRFSRYLRPLHLAAGQIAHLPLEFEQEFAGLEQLLKQADRQLQLINAEQLRSLIPTGYTPSTAGDSSALLIWRQPQETNSAASQ